MPHQTFLNHQPRKLIPSSPQTHFSIAQQHDPPTPSARTALDTRSRRCSYRPCPESPWRLSRRISRAIRRLRRGCFWSSSPEGGKPRCQPERFVTFRPRTSHRGVGREVMGELTCSLALSWVLLIASSWNPFHFSNVSKAC